MTETMLKEMYLGTCHISKVSAITHLNCPKPPSAKYIRDELVTTIENYGGYDDEDQAIRWKRLAFHMRKNVPNRDFLIGMLATVSPNHEIFNKNYKPPKK